MGQARKKYNDRFSHSTDAVFALHFIWFVYASRVQNEYVYGIWMEVFKWEQDKKPGGRHLRCQKGLSTVEQKVWLPNIADLKLAF